MNKYGIYNSFYSKLTMFQIKINIETSDEKNFFLMIFNCIQLSQQQQYYHNVFFQEKKSDRYNRKKIRCASIILHCRHRDNMYIMAKKKYILVRCEL